MIIAVSDRLLLRRFQPATDAAGLHELNADPEVERWTGDPPFADVAAARDFLAAYDHYEQFGYGRWALVLRPGGGMAGFCGLKRLPELDEVDLAFRVHRRLWGQGLATEAGRLALETGFGRYDLPLVVGRAMKDNGASEAVLRKLGFTFTGNIPGADGADSGWRRFELARDAFTGGVHLREIRPDDLPALFAHQRDPVAVRMAAFTADDPDDEEAFGRRMGRILGDAAVTKRVIVADGAVAGNVMAYDLQGRREVCYWLGREHWGRGLATRALRAFLCEHGTRPLGARVAHDNAASLRVLARCGFRVVGEACGYAAGRGEETRELLLQLDGDPT